MLLLVVPEGEGRFVAVEFEMGVGLCGGVGDSVRVFVMHVTVVMTVGDWSDPVLLAVVVEFWAVKGLGFGREREDGGRRGRSAAGFERVMLVVPWGEVVYTSVLVLVLDVMSRSVSLVGLVHGGVEWRFWA